MFVRVTCVTSYPVPFGAHYSREASRSTWALKSLSGDRGERQKRPTLARLTARRRKLSSVERVRWWNILLVVPELRLLPKGLDRPPPPGRSERNSITSRTLHIEQCLDLSFCAASTMLPCVLVVQALRTLPSPLCGPTGRNNTLSSVLSKMMSQLHVSHSDS